MCACVSAKQRHSAVLRTRVHQTIRIQTDTQFAREKNDVWIWRCMCVCIVVSCQFYLRENKAEEAKCRRFQRNAMPFLQRLLDSHQCLHFSYSNKRCRFSKFSIKIYAIRISVEIFILKIWVATNFGWRPRLNLQSFFLIENKNGKIGCAWQNQQVNRNSKNWANIIICPPCFWVFVWANFEIARETKTTIVRWQYSWSTHVHTYICHLCHPDKFLR